MEIEFNVFDKAALYFFSVSPILKDPPHLTWNNVFNTNEAKLQ